MGNVGNWVLKGCATVLAVGALFVASHAGHGLGYYGGLAMFAFSILFIMLLIRVGGDHG